MDQAQFTTMIVYTLLGALAVVVLVIVGFILRAWTRSRLTDSTTLFGSSLSTVDSLKKKGLLTSEEAEKVRQAMVRQLKDRVEQDQQANRAKGAPFVYLAQAEEEARRLREAGALPAPIQPPVRELERPLPQRPPLPDHLRLLATKSDEELDLLVSEDYISSFDRELLRRWKTPIKKHSLDDDDFIV